MMARKDADFVMMATHRSLMNAEIAKGEARAQREWPSWSQAQAANLMAACECTDEDHAE